MGATSTCCLKAAYMNGPALIGAGVRPDCWFGRGVSYGKTLYHENGQDDSSVLTKEALWSLKKIFFYPTLTNFGFHSGNKIESSQKSFQGMLTWGEGCGGFCLFRPETPLREFGGNLIYTLLVFWCMNPTRYIFLPECSGTWCKSCTTWVTLWVLFFRSDAWWTGPCALTGECH